MHKIYSGVKGLAFVVTLVLGSFVGAGYAHACAFDSDCGVGAVCQKNGGLYGVCLSHSSGYRNGALGGLVTDADAADAGLAACTFNTDCQSGYRCAKQGLDGFCVKNQ